MVYIDNLKNKVDSLLSYPNKHQVPLDLYCQIYETFKEVLSMFGGILGFAISDIEHKIGILKTFMQGPNKDHYVTVTSMIEYEKQNGSLTNPKQSYTSGTRTFIVLHRAYEFLRMVFDRLLNKSFHHMSSSHIIRDCYELTISKRHIWLVRKAVAAASCMLPKKDKIVQRITGCEMITSETEKKIFCVLELLAEVEKLGNEVIPQDLKEIP